MTLRTLFFCGMTLMMLAGCAKSQETYEKSFKQSFRTSFVSSCVESATKGPNGLTAELARTKCDCMATHLVDTYSSTELTKLAVVNSSEADTIMDGAINACK